jgi:hypothetical protein
MALSSSVKECFICYDEISVRSPDKQGLELAMSGCGCHPFVHEKCLLDWASSQAPSRRNKCPMCRTEGMNYTLMYIQNSQTSTITPGTGSSSGSSSRRTRVEQAMTSSSSPTSIRLEDEETQRRLREMLDSLVASRNLIEAQIEFYRQSQSQSHLAASYQSIPASSVPDTAISVTVVPTSTTTSTIATTHSQYHSTRQNLRNLPAKDKQKLILCMISVVILVLLLIMIPLIDSSSS